MSVLSRPKRHKVTAPTQREVRIPLPRTSPEPEGPAPRPSPQTTQPAPMPDRRARTIKLVGGGLAVALAVGVGTYMLVDDDGGGSTVIAPSVPRAPSAADLGRDRALANRDPARAAVPAPAAPAVPAPVAKTEAEIAAAQAQRLRNSSDDATGFAGSLITPPGSTAVSEAERQARLEQRRRHLQEDAVAGTGAGTGSVDSDAARLSEARRDAALARRAQNFTP